MKACSLTLSYCADTFLDCDSEEAAQSFARIEVSGKLGIICHILFDRV